MRTNGFIVTILAATVGLTGCDGKAPNAPTQWADGDSSVSVTRTQPIGAISAVTVRGGGRLVIDQGGPEILTITAAEHVLPQLEVEIAGGRLVVAPASGAGPEAQRNVYYRIGARALREIEAVGAITVESSTIDVDSLTVRLGGSSGADISGTAAELRLEVTGAGRALVDGLKSADVHVAATGSSYARARSSGRLTISAAGASVVEYFGDPILSITVAGASVVRRIGP